MVVVPGWIVVEPEAPTLPMLGSIETEVAPYTFHVNVEAEPEIIPAGLALNDNTMGGGMAELLCTITVVEAVAVPAALDAVRI